MNDHEGEMYVEVAVAIGEGGRVNVCPVEPSYEYTNTQAKALALVKRPLNVAVGILSGYVRRLSDAEQWELKTPTCDKKHKKNPFVEVP